MDVAFIGTITGIVGEASIRTDRRERKMYSTDIGVMPPLVQPFVKSGIPGAVVRPEDEQQISRIVQAARDARVPLVARAAATSGYGGILPRKGALVLDLSGWQKVISVDAGTGEVRCQAGVIWEELDWKLEKNGLELRLYPSSYPSSTVAGWLAQGGNGFGSYEYGAFKDNVVSARVILPDGQVREFSGCELQDLVADAEGITGIITEVTLKVRRREETSVRLISLPDVRALGEALQQIVEKKLPLWSLSFLNPTSVELKKTIPARTCHAYEAESVSEEATGERNLPVSYLLIAAFPSSRAQAIDTILPGIVSEAGGILLSDEDAQREWAGRTAPMRLKRIGPSIIPTEVVVPLQELAATLKEIDRKIHQPFVLEGMLNRDGRVILLGYIPHDERTFAFNPAFALSLSVMKIAGAHGGSGYSTGLYFRNEAPKVLGAARLKKLEAFKKATDPLHMMNPGKVVKTSGEGGRALDFLMSTASTLEAAIRPLANSAKPGRRRREVERHGIPGGVAYMATACARCGYCVHTCEQYSGRGWESQSPRGKYAWIREVYNGREKWDHAASDTFLSCTTCERCDLRCQLQLPVEQNGMALRNKLVEEQGMGTFPPFEMMAASLHGEGDIWAGRRLHRADWLPSDVKEKLPGKADVLYFAGCTASYVETDIAESTLRLLQDSGVSVAYLGTEESCCGIPMKMAGKDSLFTEVYERNIAAARSVGARTIVTSCPACALVWKEFYAQEATRRGEPYEFEVKHYSELIAPALADGTIKLQRPVFEGRTVTFHDSCHAGRAQGIYEPPRDMLKAIPGIDYVEMEHNREEGICCGSVVTLVGEMPVAPKLGCARLQEAIEAGADTVVALCPCCQVQLRDSASKGHMDLEVDDLARVVATAAGYDIPTSKTVTTYMWGFFERFINLMQPEQMASFMVRIFPQMVEAMPSGMGLLMRGMAQTSAGRTMLAAMMPVMFPYMAPGILGKTMPALVDAVGSYIGEMPDDMAQMMPDLLPQTMEALMPTYIPQLIPYLVPRFVDYLHESGKTSTKQIA